jgi:predicted metal-dependent hydrolase
VEPKLRLIESIPRQTRKRSTRRQINADRVPDWAKALTHRIASDYEFEEVPPIRWRESRINMQTAGSTHWEGTRANGKHRNISILAGRNVNDARLVLVHELAHWSLPPKCGHNRRFWRRCWEMYERYGVNLDYAYNREKSYKMKAAEEAPVHVRMRHEGGD